MNIREFTRLYKNKRIRTSMYPDYEYFIPQVEESEDSTHFITLIKEVGQEGTFKSLFHYEEEDWVLVEELGQEEQKVEERALRFNANKLNLAEDLPYNAICALATVVLRNSERYGGKYPDKNYRKLAKESEYMNCLLRHFMQHMSGEKVDHTDGVPHLYKIAWNACMAIEASILKPELSDLTLNFKLDFNHFMQIINKERNNAS